MTAAVERDGAAQQALLLGNRAAARVGFAEAACLYRQSWEEAPPSAYGRLVGMLKAAVLAGGGDLEAAKYARKALADADPESATAAYARALAALILGEDGDAAAAAEVMLGGGDAFARTGEAVAAIAARDTRRFSAALGAIVGDFEARTEHLTGVAIADTALVLAALAERRGIAAGVESPVLPVL
jgi:hypothetical protein